MTRDFNSGPSTCTATHIGDGLVLTAGHCLRGEQLYRRITPDAQNEQRRFASRVFDFDGRTERGVLVDAELSPERDYAIFKIDHALAAKATVKLDERAPIGTRLAVLSFPAHRPGLSLSSDCQIHSADGLGHRLFDLAPSHFAYDCASAPGSSGAAVLEEATGEIVGILNGGVDAPERNYGTSILATPVAQYLKKLPLPLATLTTSTDTGKSYRAEKTVDVSVEVASGDVVQVDFEIVDDFEPGTLGAPVETRTSAPWTATFDVSALEGPHHVRAVVTDANGASRVFENGAFATH